MLSDNLNKCAINKYTNMLCDDYHVQQQYGKCIRPTQLSQNSSILAILTQLK